MDTDVTVDKVLGTKKELEKLVALAKRRSEKLGHIPGGEYLANYAQIAHDIVDRDHTVLEPHVVNRDIDGDYHRVMRSIAHIKKTYRDTYGRELK